ncbi:MAG: formyltransferase family protein, partial [Nanoarchaeota archaeon]
MVAINKVLYIGYGFNGEPGLDSLLKEGSFNIVGVVTPPLLVSRLTYRINLDPLPVEILAEKNGLLITRTNSEDEIHKIINRTEPASVITCFYNISFSPVILDSGPSFYNIHHGDIPHWKGTSSSEWAIASGRNEVYITLHETVPRIDSGDIVWQYKITITDDEDINDMRKKMNNILRLDLGRVYAKVLNPEKYPELDRIVYRRKLKGEESYTCSIRDTDSEIDCRKPAREIYILVRALCNEELSPAYTFV